MDNNITKLVKSPTSFESLSTHSEDGIAGAGLSPQEPPMAPESTTTNQWKSLDEDYLRLGRFEKVCAFLMILCELIIIFFILKGAA